MEKPITIRREEFMQSLCDISNQAGLPAFVMLEVIERLKNQLESMVQAEYQRDMLAYQSAQKEEDQTAEEKPKKETVTISGQVPINDKEETKDADECV